MARTGNRTKDVNASENRTGIVEQSMAVGHAGGKDNAGIALVGYAWQAMRFLAWRVHVANIPRRGRARKGCEDTIPDAGVKPAATEKGTPAGRAAMAERGDREARLR